MKIYDLLRDLIFNNHYEKYDMTNKLNVFYAFNQITLDQYTELMAKVNPDVKDDVEHKEKTKHSEVTE